MIVELTDGSTPAGVAVVTLARARDAG